MLNPTVKYSELSLRELSELGYLQEANRQFFHPLGLCLAISAPLTEPNNWDNATLVVLDHRDDPEGVVFAPGDSGQRQERAARVDALLSERAKTREDLLGYIFQPVEKL